MKRPEKSSSQSAVVNLAIAAQFGLFCIETQCRNVFAYLNPLQVLYVLFFNLEHQLPVVDDISFRPLISVF